MFEIQAKLKKVRVEKSSLKLDREVSVSRAKKLEINPAKKKKVEIQLKKELEHKNAFCEAKKDWVAKELQEAYNGMFPVIVRHGVSAWILRGLGGVGTGWHLGGKCCI